MFQFLNNIRISPNTEIVCLLVLGTLFQMTDGSPFQIKKKWEAVWSTDLPREYFSPIVQRILKTGLSVIVAARCGATYPYIASAMLVIFCLLKDRAPKLMLPWIFIAGMKSICMTFLEALTGVYVCSAFGKIHKACIEFFISKALEIIFAAYLWGSVLSVYQDLERRQENERILQNPEIAYIKKMDFKRKRARSLLDETTLYKTACLNNFEFKDVPQIILQMLRRADEMSQDSLLGPGMMLASVSNMGSFDNLKKSESLGELGYTNLQTTKVIGLDEEENLSPPEKALKFLKMTWSDVRRVQRNGTYMECDISSINSDPWLHLTINEAHIYKPKQARTEIFIRELPEQEFDEDYLKKKNIKKTYDIKLGVSLFNLIKKNELDYNEDEESFVDSQEETEEEDEEERDDEEMSKIFMSNIKDEKPVNRIGLNIPKQHIKGTAYSKLYKKDFMSVIGPEVFERATKLPKVTSFVIRKPNTEKTPSEKTTSTRTYVTFDSQSETSDSNWSETMNSSLDEDFEKNVDISARVAKEIAQELVDSLPENEITKKESIKENKSRIKRRESESSPSQKSNDKKTSLCLMTPPPPLDKSVKFMKIRPPCYRKRRIRIKWIGKLKENNLIECVSTTSNFSNNSDDSSDFPPTPETDSDADDTDFRPENAPRRSTLPLRPSLFSKKNERSSKEITQDQDIYFLIELLHRPLPEVLRKYYDLKNIVYTRRELSTLHEKELDLTNNFYKIYCLKRFEEVCEYGGKDYNKIWKSKVLKAAEVHQQPITGDFLNKIDHDVINKLLRYQYLFLTKKIKENSSVKTLHQADAEDIKNNKEQSLIKLNPSILNELRCESSSENVFQSREIFLQNNMTYCSQRNFTETPSEHSIEVSRNDLINEKIFNSEQVASSSEGCSKDGEFKTSDKEEVFENTENNSLCSQESDEPISLYYSKAANLASPLLDMKKFIYPDHIHYSYKHVNKKGFDVNISGDLPLLVQSQALSPNNNLHVKEIPAMPEPEITRRPMDLSFAKTNAFAEWQNSDQNVSDPLTQPNEKCKKIKTTPSSEEMSKRKKEKGSKSKRAHDDETNATDETSSHSHHVWFTQNNTICEKPPNLSNENEHYDEERTPIQISSTQLHSNKGRISSTYSPALRLQENKKEGKKKAESQEKRTKEMLARLEREILFPKQKWL